MTGPYRCFEVVRNLGELNHLITIISDLGSTRGFVREARAQAQFGARAYNAYRVPFEDALDAAKHFGLVRSHGNGLVLTDAGRAFQSRNPQRLYSPTQGQRSMLVTSLLFSQSHLSQASEELIEDFMYNRDTARFERKSSGPSPSEDLNHLRFLAFSLGLFVPDPIGVIVINPIYSGQVRRKIRILRNKDWMDADPTDLDLELSHHAEEVVAEAERARLVGLDRADLAASVEIVSEYDSTQGFDILSYQGGNSQLGIHDRFVEVKSSTARTLRFIITHRELERARELRDAYHIVFMGGNSPKATIADCSIEEMRDPSRLLFNPEKFLISSKRMLVERARLS